MTPPGIHTNHLFLITGVKNLSAHFVFVFITLFALSLYGCEHLTKAGGMEMMDF